MLLIDRLRGNVERKGGGIGRARLPQVRWSVRKDSPVPPQIAVTPQTPPRAVCHVYRSSFSLTQIEYAKKHRSHRTGGIRYNQQLGSFQA